MLCSGGRTHLCPSERFAKVSLPVRCSSQNFSIQQSEEVISTVPALISSLKSCSRSRNLERGKEVHAIAADSGQELNLYVASSLVDMYANCGSMVNARRIFERMRRHDLVSWNTLILGYVENGEGELALHLFGVMQCEGYAPNMRTFVAVLKACINVAAKDDGQTVKIKTLKRGMAFHSQAVNSTCGWDMFVESAVVDMYAKCGSLSDAERVFDRMQRQDVVSWTILLLAYADKDEGKLALNLYASMRAEGCKPTGPTFVAALKACTSLAGTENSEEINGQLVNLVAAETGMALHLEATKFRCDSDLIVATSLIDTYAKCGLLSDANRVFDRMNLQDVVAWNTLISGYGENGEFKAALELFSRMRSDGGVVANSRTYIAALKACSGLADIRLGKAIHGEVCLRGLESLDFVLTTSLLDFYGRCGNMADAERVFDYATKQDIVMWSALITGYSHAGDTDNAFKTFQKMRERGVTPDGVTVLSILAACNHAGLVETAKAIFKGMKIKFGIAPEIDHFHCMVDLLGRASQLEEAVELVKSMPYEANAVTWTMILSKCRKWNNVGIGKLAFDALVEIDEKQAVAYALMVKTAV